MPDGKNLTEMWNYKGGWDGGRFHVRPQALDHVSLDLPIVPLPVYINYKTTMTGVGRDNKDRKLWRDLLTRGRHLLSGDTALVLSRVGCAEFDWPRQDLFDAVYMVNLRRFMPWMDKRTMGQAKER